LEFSALTGVHPMIEKYPLSRVAEAYVGFGEMRMPQMVFRTLRAPGHAFPRLGIHRTHNIR
jgi:hypothetical protein